MSEEKPVRPRIASPCISVCRLDPFADFCTGCFRTLDEIGKWPDYSNDERRVIMESLRDRKMKLKARPRGP